MSITHVNIFCEDLAASRSFVTEICGINLVYNEPEINASFFSNGYSHHDLALMQCSDTPLIGADGKVQNTMRNGSRPGLNHLGFELRDEAGLIEAFKWASSHPERSGIVKTLDHGISHSVYVRDPDGNLLEFYADVVDDWRKFYRLGADSLITSQWDPLTQTDPSKIDPQRTTERIDDALFHPRRFARATLLVADLQRSLDYYTQVAGMTILLQDHAERLALLGGRHGLYDLALVEAREGEKTGLDLIAFEIGIDEDESAFEATLASRGYRHAAYRSDFKSSIIVQDRDGFNFEFQFLPPKVDPARPPVRADLIAAF